MNGTSDHELIERIRRGEQRAFALLLDRYQTVVYNIAFRILDSHSDAEDTTQTVFLKVYENIAAYNPRYRFFSWLYRIAINEALNAKKRMSSGMDIESIALAADQDLDREARIRDMEDQIGSALMLLTPENRAIVILRHYQEFTYREIAYIMDLTEEKIKSRLYSARQQLGRILTQRGLRAEL